MKKFMLCLLTVSLSGALYCMESFPLNATGSIDKETNYALTFDAGCKQEHVQFTHYNNVEKSWTESGKYPITSVEIIETDAQVKNNDFIFKTEKGDFFIPKWRSNQVATFNQKPITLIRAEDIMMAAHAHDYKPKKK